MLKNKNDQEIERLMNEQGLSHFEAMAQMRAKSKKKSKAPEGSPAEEAAESPAEEATEEASGEDNDADDSMETVALPAALVPGAAVGKEVDISVTGIVKSKSGGMVNVELSRTSGSSREPMPPAKAVSVDYPR